MTRTSPLISFLLAGFVLPVIALIAHAMEPTPPAGFRAIFNGKDLTGWYGLNPHDGTKLTGEQKEANLKKQRADFAKHWRIENGELVNDGTGPYATTEGEFGDIEFRIEYKTVAKADSGIYVRGTPHNRGASKTDVLSIISLSWAGPKSRPCILLGSTIGRGAFQNLKSESREK